MVDLALALIEREIGLDVVTKEALHPQIIVVGTQSQCWQDPSSAL